VPLVPDHGTGSSRTIPVEPVAPRRTNHNGLPVVAHGHGVAEPVARIATQVGTVLDVRGAVPPVSAHAATIPRVAPPVVLPASDGYEAAVVIARHRPPAIVSALGIRVISGVQVNAALHPRARLVTTHHSIRLMGVPRGRCGVGIPLVDARQAHLVAGMGGGGQRTFALGKWHSHHKHVAVFTQRHGICKR